MPEKTPAIYDVLDAEGGGLRLQLEVQPRPNYALALAGIGVVRSVRAWAPRDRSLPGLAIDLTLTTSVAEPVSVTLRTEGEILPGSLISFDDAAQLGALTRPLAQAAEACHGLLEVSASTTAGEKLARVEAALSIDAFNEFRAEPRTYAALAPFVQPNSAALTPILQAASELLRDKTKSAALEGYQAGPERAHRIAGAIYESLRHFRITYINPPASFETTGQKVRTTEQVLAQKMGTCIDLAVLYAAALEAAGLYPVVFLAAGHAFSGYYADETYGERPAVTDPNVVANIVEAGLVLPVELTGVGTAGRAGSFASARTTADRYVRAMTADLRGMVDIVRCRLDGVLPMPSADGARQLTDTEVLEARPFVARSTLANLSQVTPREARHALRIAEDASPARFKAWKRDLLDLSLRNPLLNLPRNRRVVDLLVPGGLLPKVDDWLHQGRAVRLVAGDQVGELADARGVRLAAELNADAVEMQFDLAKSLFTLASGTWAMGALRHMRRDSRLLEQETGSNYLYLTIGTLVHAKPSGGEARAPIFLLPVRLSGGIGSMPYSIKADADEEAIANLCLVQWLAVTRGIAFPELTETRPEDEPLSLPQALRGMRRHLAEEKLPLRIEESASLAILRFGTFQIWRDLDANWRHFMTNPVVSHLVERPGETFADPAPAADGPLDEASFHLPIAADGSQLRAIASGAAGRSFVLEGPPGTGKSQTIANLIAHSLAIGKKVLFVAEKQAALDVVSRRLREVGIAPYCLDLHGEQQTMAAIRTQLRDALAARAPEASYEWQATDARRGAALAELRTYPALVHARNAAGHSLWSAYDALRALGRGPSCQLPAAVVAGATDADGMSAKLRAGEQAALRLQDTAVQLGLRERHPWLLAASGSTHAASQDAIAAAIDELVAARPVLAELTDLGRDLLSAFPPPGRLAGALDLLTTRGTDCQPQVGDAAWVTRPSWPATVSALERDTVALPRDFPVLAALAPGAVHAEQVSEWLERARAADASWWLRGRKRRKLLAEMETYVTRPPVPDQLTAFLTDWRAAAQRAAEIDAAARAVAGMRLPAAWRSDAPDAAGTLRRTAYLAQLAAQFDAEGHLAPLYALGSDDESRWRRIAAAWREWLAALGGTDRSRAWWQAGADWLQAWAESEPVWRQGIAVSGALHAQRFAALAPHVAALDAAGLGPFADDAMTGRIAPPEIVIALARSLAAASLIERRETAGLTSFDAARLDDAVRQYERTATETRIQAVERVPAQIAARRPFDPDRLRGEVAELGRQIERKRGGKTFRQLVADYPSALTALTPCFLMSPGSVAHFLDASSITFDMAIFDEASQIRVPQAIGAMGRARSVIVVGDSKQMPPTRVMEVDTSRFEEEQRQASTTEQIVVEDLESILSEAVESGLPQEYLAWHYRSRDESLIAFSNERYYASRLVTLPAPQLHGRSAVSWRRVDGSFDRGGARTNLIEAQAIVDEIAARLADPATREQSIGVVTFNIQQRDLILTLLEDSPDLHIRQALEAETGSDLFVKNLENVQGDERDTILFSLAFSPDPVTGILPLNFGPLNLEGGERRLNVAVTRARESVVVFSSFDPAHIDLTRTTSKGLADLRDYLQYAADGPVAAAHANASRDRLGDEVAAALRERGLEVARGVGLSAFSVDVAARRPGTSAWELAIMLDSPAWNSRPTVADRDGAPELLHDLMGWPRVRRVWLPGWLRSADECVERLLAALDGPADTLMTAGGEPAPTPASAASAPASAPQLSPTQERAAHGAAGAQPTGGGSQVIAAPASAIADRPAPITGPFTPAPRAKRFEQSALNSARSLPQYAVSIAKEVLAVEGPVPIERLTATIGRVCGFARIGAAKRAEIEAALAGSFKLTGLGGTVVWPAGADPDTWRGVRRTTGGDRTFDEVTLYEVANAIELVTREAMSVTRDQLDRETLDVLGFIRVTDTIRPRLDAAVHHAQATGRIAYRDGRYYPT